MSVEFNHISVLLEESVNLLEVKPDGVYARSGIYPRISDRILPYKIKV